MGRRVEGLCWERAFLQGPKALLLDEITADVSGGID